MRRREFLGFVGGAAAMPFVARAQERVRRIGVLGSSIEADPEIQARMAALRQGLARFGWSEGRNIQITYRFTGGSAEQAASLAKELVALKPDLIVATATSLAAALQRETRVIPVVFTGVVDPVRSGLIVSLARPGGNLTGGLLNEPSVAGKWLGMLKEYAPKLKRVAVLTNPKSGPYQSFYQETAETVARTLGIELVPSLIEGPADIERIVAGFAAGQDGGLLVPPDLTAASNHDLVIALAARYRLPAVYQARFWVQAGGLMSYGPDTIARYRQTAYYVDRVLRGVAPADLPVQAATKYETVLNLKTARALGLEVPPGILVAADEVIE